MTMAAIAADLLVSQHQVQRLMAMRRHFQRQKPPPVPDWFDAWGAAMAMQLDEASFQQSALAVTGRAANDERMEVPA